MKISQIIEIRPPRFTRRQFDAGIEELRSCLGDVTPDRIASRHRERGRESDKSISKAVNGLITQSLFDLGWEQNWSYCPSVKSNHATFVASKVFGDNSPIRFALDIASRHSNEALGYLVKGQLAKKQRMPVKYPVDAHVLFAYDQECLDWGRWHSSVYSFEKLMENAPLLEGSITTPLWIFCISKPDGLSVTTSLAGTLKVQT